MAYIFWGGVFFEWRNEWFTDIPSLCHHQWQCCSCKAPKHEARQQMAHGPIGQGWSLEFQVWPSPSISLCLQLIFRAKLDGRWTMQLKVLADLNLWRPQSLRRLFLGMGSKHQVISSVNMIIHDPWVRLGQVFVHVEVDITWYHPVWYLANMSWCWRNRWQKTSSGNWTKQNQLFSEITWKYCF